MMTMMVSIVMMGWTRTWYCIDVDVDVHVHVHVHVDGIVFGCVMSSPSSSFVVGWMVKWMETDRNKRRAISDESVITYSV